MSLYQKRSYLSVLVDLVDRDIYILAELSLLRGQPWKWTLHTRVSRGVLNFEGKPFTHLLLASMRSDNNTVCIKDSQLIILLRQHCEQKSAFAGT